MLGQSFCLLRETSFPASFVLLLVVLPFLVLLSHDSLVLPDKSNSLSNPTRARLWAFSKMGKIHAQCREDTLAGANAATVLRAVCLVSKNEMSLTKSLCVLWCLAVSILTRQGVSK